MKDSNRRNNSENMIEKSDQICSSNAPFYKDSNIKRIAESVEQANLGKLHTLTFEEFEQYGNS